ncbi:MAG: protein kinase [Acidobacteria bacterium]|nr:protein kinase [Acidobacteriota bacterium]
MENFDQNVLAPGEILDGQYRIEKVLGKGGMGVVYLVRHTLLNDLRAIKLVLPNLANQQYIQRFLREGQVACLVRHPNIINIYDLRVTTDGTVYMVMEYFDGHTLAEELKSRKKFTPQDAFEMLEPIANALEIAHKNGVIHRDVHPSNIMIKEISQGKYHAKLLDLGLAKVRPTISSAEEAKFTQLTMVGQILGTPYYMSPEQWEPKSEYEDNIDGRTDIYSLGIVFYELISGRKPFVGQTMQNLAYQHFAITPPSLHEVDPNVPKAFSDVISQAMSKMAEHRQSSVEEMFTQLRESLFSKPITNTGPHKPIERKIIVKHLSGSKKGQIEEFVLSMTQEITFGRDPISKVAYDPYKDDVVARNQAKIIFNGNDFNLIDNNSRNGTFVNNQQVRGSIKIQEGNKIRFGNTGPEFIFDLSPLPIPPTQVTAMPMTKFGANDLFATLTERIVIKHLTGSRAGQEDIFPTRDLQEIIIGRDPLSMIKYDSLKDDLVSTKHAKIFLEPSVPIKYALVDLNSRNGTFLNKQRIMAKTLIKSGDKVQLGASGPEFEFNIC